MSSNLHTGFLHIEFMATSPRFVCLVHSLNCIGAIYIFFEVFSSLYFLKSSPSCFLLVPQILCTKMREHLLYRLI